MSDQAPEEKCQNCQQMLPSHKLTSHFAYCRRNIKKCQKCDRYFDINYSEDHFEQFHKVVPCPHCQMEVPPSQLQAHKAQCSKKPIYCQFCQLDIPFAEYESHISKCENRTKTCEKCKKPVTLSKYLKHSGECVGEDSFKSSSQMSPRYLLRRNQNGRRKKAKVDDDYHPEEEIPQKQPRLKRLRKLNIEEKYRQESESEGESESELISMVSSLDRRSEENLQEAILMSMGHRTEEIGFDVDVEEQIAIMNEIARKNTQ